MSHEHPDTEVYKSRVRVLENEVAALTGTVRAQLDIIENLEHRIVVLESRMENVLARLDGHDLGFVTMGLDDVGKEKLAHMLRPDRSIVPEEEGTSR